MRFAVLVCLLASAVLASTTQQVQPFKQGQTYVYRFRTQVSSSLLANDPSTIQQQAATGMQAQLKLTFTNDHHARVQLQHVRLGEMNGHNQGGQQQMIPTEMFEKRSMPEEMKQQLEEPFTVQLVDGVIQRIQFQSEEESSWSKNVKRAAVNMLQLNLKRNDVQGLMKQSSQPQDEKEQRQSSVFSIPEITLEGVCETTYTVQQKSQYGEQNSEEQDREQQQPRQFNVTKTINFNKCQQTSDVAYGFQPNAAQQLRCHKCLKQTEIKASAVGKTEKQELLKLTQCQNECQTNQLTNNKNVERSTAGQFELDGTTQKYGLRRARIVSQYVVKGQNPEAQNTISQVVAISELTLERDSQDSSPVPAPKQSTKDTTLLYEPEWDVKEKRWFMYGDEEFSSKNSPFGKVHGKVEQVAKYVQQIMKQWAEDKEMGYELNSALIFNRLVQVIRQSNTQELKQIEQQVKEIASSVNGQGQEYESEKHAKSLFYDALAVAATRNSIHFLAQKIQQGKIGTLKAAQLIKVFIGNQIAPSDRQADILEQIATSEPAQKCKVLRQVSWLAYGSAIGKICQQQPAQSQQEQFRVEELCPEAKKEQYKKTMILQWKQAETIHAQVLALKVIGNSALDKTLPELQKIITDKRQPTILRIESIDALRRLRTNRPEQIVQILLPIYQNQREQPEIRMASVSMILYTQPSAAILDQIVFIVQNDRSQNVKSFVLTALESLSRSPVNAERQVAEHLKAALKIVKISPEQMRMSRKYHRVPIYVSSQQDTEEQNIFLGLASIMSPANMIPVHLSTSLFSAFNGDATQEKIQLSFTQKDLEQLYEKLSNAYSRFGDERSGKNSDDEPESAKMLDNMYSTLGIKSRRSGSHFLSSEEESSENFQTIDGKRSTKLGSNQPYGMIVLRINDQDQFVLSIDEKNLPEMIGKFLNGEKPSFELESYAELRSQLESGKQFQQHIALTVGESKVHIPTSTGLPLAIIWQTSAVASIEGQVKAKLEIMREDVKGELELRSSAIATHMHKTEIWTPAFSSGVLSLRTVELNHDTMKLKVSASRSEILVSIEPPKHQQKERVLGLHTLPATYTQRFQWEKRTYGEQRLNTIRNYALEHTQHEFHANEQHQRAIRVEGNIHYVQGLKQLVNALYTTENNVHVYFNPTEQTPEHLSLKISGFSFRNSEKSEHTRPQFDDFYKQTSTSERKPFRSIYEDEEDQEEYKQMQFQSVDQRESRLSGYVSKYQSGKAYKHRIHVLLQARTRTQQIHEAEASVQATCDQGLKHCKAVIHAQRSPLPHEQEKWQIQANIQSVLPENVRGEENPEEKQSRLLVKAEAEWGFESNEQQNSVHLRVQGEPTRKNYWRQDSSDKWSRALNKWDLVVDYKLGHEQRHMAQRGYELAKAYYFWQVESQPERKGEANTVRASLVIDPISRRTANLTVQSPVERIRVQQIELPAKIQGFQLERRPASYHSFGQLMQSFAHNVASECRADDRRVRTFDNVEYRAPISSGCWTVLAKDCRENPRFAVLMKKTDEETKIKIITRENTIELYKQQEKQQMVVKINDQKVNDEEKLSEQGIELSNYQVHVSQQGISVRFDGEEASIKVSGLYKNLQCGLCGKYSDEENDDFQMANGKRSDSLRRFHQSYTLKNQECSEEKINKHYRDQGSEEFRVKPRKQQSAYYRDSFQQQDEDESRSSEQWWSSSEEQNKENNKKTKPVERTQLLEYSQKVCFSMQPVKKCPQGSVRDESTEPKTQKVQFFCLERSSSQARRLQRQVRQGKLVESDGQQPSFFDNVEEPIKCQEADFY